MKIGVVGLGLIGGSIFKALKDLKYDVVVVSNSQKGLKSNITDDYSILKSCDIVFVAVSMNKTPDILTKLEDIVDENTLVTDVCSLKEFVCKRDYKFIFVPSHPMAGTEKQGFDNSFKELFNGAKWVICKDYLKNIDVNQYSNRLADLIYIIEQMGAKVIFANAQEHDAAVAMISHMPMVISQALFSIIKDNELAKKLASSGFRDMTRLALSNIEMAEDMVNMNAQNIEKAIIELYSSVGDLLKKDYISKIEEIKDMRQKMYDENGKNIY